MHSDWAGLAGKLVAQSDTTLTTMVPHGASCEDMKDTRSLPSWTVWGKPLTGGRYALTALNTRPDQDAVISVGLKELGFEGGVTETDVWTGKATALIGADWKATLPAGSGNHRFVILAPKK